MIWGRSIFWALCVQASLSVVCCQEPEKQERQPVPESQSSDEQPGHRLKGLHWLKLGIEFRGRVESTGSFESPGEDPVYLNRFRLSVTAQPVSWARFFVQGQDARAFGLGRKFDYGDLRDTLDLRQAYVAIGHGEQGWQLRVGRQELVLGDERLVGADTDWDCFGQAFDAVRLNFAASRWSVTAFAGFRVQPARRRPNPFDTANRISGVSVQLKMRETVALEPYLLWKRGSDTLDLSASPGHRDVMTPGVLARGPLPHGLDYNVEMALQRGHVVADEISAWAGHWELGWKPRGKAFRPRLGLEYNFASGDRNPGDGKHGTFDDLYPAGFNKYGTPDPIAWRNIRYPAWSVEIPAGRRWTIYGCYRHYWLASVKDGLYPGGDEYLVRNPAAASPDVGSQALVSAAYDRPERWHMAAGYGYLFPGAFLRQSGFQTALRTTYLLLGFTF